jgi:hypothetical protein
MEENTFAARMVRAAAAANLERLNDPNVVCVGYGLKFREGKPTDEVALQYYVLTKFRTEEEITRAGSSSVPGEVDGVKTDVIEMHASRATQCPTDRGMPTGGRGTRQEHPLVGGTSSTVLSGFHSFPTGYGTLGGIVFDAPAGLAGARGAAMALSNAHVWGPTTGLDVIQPWLPIDEYLEATVKLALCGPGASFILDTTVPSPLTAGLAAGAAAAFVAAAASDAEDPSRWGQRVGAVPPAGAVTRSESVHVATELPAFPFAGSHYSTRTTWNYSRDTTAGVTSEQIDAERENEHVLLGKRVWTERVKYRAGERIQICAELKTHRQRDADDFFVVAHCYPIAHPDRLVKRVLRPGACKPVREFEPVCFRGFSSPAAPKTTAWFPIHEGPFGFDGVKAGHFHGPWPPGGPDALTILQLPIGVMKMVFPPCARVELEMLQGPAPVRLTARNSAGDVVAQAATGTQQGQRQVVQLRAYEITSVTFTLDDGQAFLIGACTYRESGCDGDDVKQEYKTHKEPPRHRCHTYTGFLDLELREDPEQWAIVLFVQTVDPNPTGTDPAKAATELGGIVASANMVEPVGCTIVMLLDHVFNVI